MMTAYDKINDFTVSHTVIEGHDGYHSPLKGSLIEVFNFKSRKVTSIFEMAEQLGYTSSPGSHSGASIQVTNFSDFDDDSEIMEAAEALKEMGGDPGDLDKAPTNRFKIRSKNRSPSSIG